MDSSVKSLFSKKERWTVDDIQSHIDRSKVVLFGRGDSDRPRCGYTKDAIEVLKTCGCTYELVDVEVDRSASAALRAFVGPVHLPVMFVDGELIGTSDTLPSLISSGELNKRLGS